MGMNQTSAAPDGEIGKTQSGSRLALLPTAPSAPAAAESIARFNGRKKRSMPSQAALIAIDLLAPPAGSRYEVWLFNDEERNRLGLLTLDGTVCGE